MGKFIQLTRETGQPVFVAADKITFVTIEDGSTLIGQFGESGLGVIESLEDVILKLTEH